MEYPNLGQTIPENNAETNARLNIPSTPIISVLETAVENKNETDLRTEERIVTQREILRQGDASEKEQESLELPKV